jgi:site-specific recombinase XerD
MIEGRWRVGFTRRDLPSGSAFGEWLDDWDGWLDRADVVEDTPYLLSPMFDYDVELNSFFVSAQMRGKPWNTLAAYARDMAGFFTFLWAARGQRGWRDAAESDHLAYKSWRCQELRRSGSTWGREVATVNVFYDWAWRAGFGPVNPIPQRAARPRPAGTRGRIAYGATTPATAPHHAAREKIEWLPPKSYRAWRDVGLRGYGADGLPEERFRGRWAGRNALFSDLMVRTGLRLSEQAALTVFDLPTHPMPGQLGYQRFWLPAAVAKWGSARWVYVPVGLVRELETYRELDRPEAVHVGRSSGAYDRLRPLVIEDTGRLEVSVPAGPGVRHRVRLENLTAKERRSVLVDTPQGFEPAAFWLTEEGLPVAVSSWKDLFARANARCAQRGLDVRCHPHMLRHSFAVVALEQLQRGHLRELSGMSPAQRTHYTQVFGDPLDWVRRRLGHASIVTTQIYLHCLAELEMDTRTALVPDWWADPRDLPLDRVAEDPPGAARNLVVDHGG